MSSSMFSYYPPAGSPASSRAIFSPYALTAYEQDLAFMSDGLLLVNIYAMGFAELVAEIEMLESSFDEESRDILGKAARLFREAAQPRSPYLYGILRGAHFDALMEEGQDPYGLMAIDPTVWHPILGGYPNEYGARIHGEGRPWFAQTIDQESDRIMGQVGSEFAGIFGSYLGGYS